LRGGRPAHWTVLTIASPASKASFTAVPVCKSRQRAVTRTTPSGQADVDVGDAPMALEAARFGAVEVPSRIRARSNRSCMARNQPQRRQPTETGGQPRR
jgi:hypothetical protein